MIRDVSGTSSGYEIDFGLSDDIMLRDETKPEIKLIEPDVGIGCIPNKIFVQFTENIRCSSFSRSNFKLTDKQGKSYGVDLDSGSCNLGGEYDRSYVLSLLAPIPAGNIYTLEIQPSTSQPVIDLCGNFLKHLVILLILPPINFLRSNYQEIQVYMEIYNLGCI